MDEQYKKLGIAFWLVAIIIAPIGLIWALTLKKGHPNKTIAIVITAILTGLMLVGIFTPSDSGGSSRVVRSEETTKAEVAKKWFQGGTLHKATISEWKNATYENKLATAGDWLSNTVWKEHLNNPSDFDKLKGKAEKLVKAIEIAIIDHPNENHSISDVAATIILGSSDLNP